MADVRTTARLIVAELGCDAAEHLPTAEPVEPRPASEVRSRCLALFGCVAVAFGLDRSVAQTWLRTAGLESSLTPSDEKFLGTPTDDDVAEYRAKIESLWVLGWTLGVVDELDWDHLCDNNFIRSFPDPRREGLASPIGEADQVRVAGDIALHVDVSYLLHHCHVEAVRNGSQPPDGVPVYAVVHRRRALEWVMSDLDWDDVSLDT